MIKKIIRGLFIGIFLISFWQGTVVILDIEKFLFPDFFSVLFQIVNNYELLFVHISITCVEAVAGCLLGVVIAYFMVILMIHSELCEKILNPIIIFTQTIPKIAIAPLLVVWFGSGFLPKIIIAASLGFFPIVVNVYHGMKNVDQGVIDVLRTYKASKFQIFMRARLPNSVKYFFIGMRTAITLSFVGAVVGEFISAKNGIGYLIIMADNSFNIELEFAAIIVLSVTTYSLYCLLEIIEKLVVKW